jgi:threonylcarbamoyladenosine tRNA methylthiotransferase MtaB
MSGSKEKKKVAFTTLGCKLNYAETSTIARKFVDDGYERVRFGEPADIIVINTCSVTQQADKKCRQTIHKAIRSAPDAYVAVIGCYSQLKADEIAAIQGVDLVLGTKEKFNILEYIDKKGKQGASSVYSCGIESISGYEASYSLADRTRAFLKVQDGCDYHCSYCTIPLARGKSRNQSVVETLEKAREIAARGTKEIVLTGVNVGDFGQSTGERFINLLRALDKIEGIARFRISSIEPNLLTPEIIDFVADSEKFVPHFHIPLQSGCNEILALMARRYKREVFAGVIRRIKAAMPHAGIGADVIIGFPGESEEQFADTFQFIESLPLSYLHVFSYSERDNTRAAGLLGKVSHADKEQRSRKLIELSTKKRLAFYTENLGKEAFVLFESKKDKGRMTGFTGNYIRVETAWEPSWTNTVQQVKLESIGEGGNVNIKPIKDKLFSNNSILNI